MLTEFKISKKEQEKILLFYESHCRQHAVPSGLIYSFVPTGIATAVGVECTTCNHKENVTDYESW